MGDSEGEGLRLKVGIPHSKDGISIEKVGGPTT